MSALYDTDYTAWLESQIKLIRNRNFEYLDTGHLLEEMEDMGGFKSSIGSYLRVALTHMLKLKYTPDPSCTRLWQLSIDNARDPISDMIENHPSLKKYPSIVLKEAYSRARRSASKQTGFEIDVFPEECPWTVEQILGD